MNLLLRVNFFECPIFIYPVSKSNGGAVLNQFRLSDPDVNLKVLECCFFSIVQRVGLSSEQLFIIIPLGAAKL